MLYMPLIRLLSDNEHTSFLHFANDIVVKQPFHSIHTHKIHSMFCFFISYDSFSFHRLSLHFFFLLSVTIAIETKTWSQKHKINFALESDYASLLCSVLRCFAIWVLRCFAFSHVIYSHIE